MDKFLIVIAPKNIKKWIVQEDFANLMQQNIQFRVIAKVMINGNILTLTPYHKPVIFSSQAQVHQGKR